MTLSARSPSSGAPTPPHLHLSSSLEVDDTTLALSTYLLLVCSYRMPHPLLRDILVYECSCVTARMTLSLPNSLAHRGIDGIVAVSFGLIVSRLIRGLRILVK